MFNILKKGSFEGGQTFNTEEDMDKFFESHDKDDYLILRTGFIKTDEEKSFDIMMDFYNEVIDHNYRRTLSLEEDLDERIHNGEAIKIASNTYYDYYALYFGAFAKRNKNTGKVSNIRYFWVDSSKGFYVKINNKRKHAAKLMYETFYTSISKNEVIKYLDNNRANLDINNLYI
jgi:hypothetical protein